MGFPRKRVPGSGGGSSGLGRVSRPDWRLPDAMFPHLGSLRAGVLPHLIGLRGPGSPQRPQDAAGTSVLGGLLVKIISSQPPVLTYLGATSVLFLMLLMPRVSQAFAVEMHCRFHSLVRALASRLIRLPCPAIQVFSLVTLQLAPHPTDIPGSFPSPCLCSGHSWGPEHPSHLPTYTVSPPLLAQD